MEESSNLDELLKQVLSKMHEEYNTLSTYDLLKTSLNEREIYFSRYSMYKELINSVEFFLFRSQKLQQAGEKLHE